VRKFRAAVRQGQKLIALLEAAQEDPRELIATPNSLLTSQPALRRLKDGLIDSQLATSKLGGTRSPDHPRVRAAIEAEQQIRKDLHDELMSAIRGAQVELQLGRDQLAASEERLANLQERFADLAEERAEYSNRVAAVDNCRLTLDRARENLGTAKAAQAAAHSGSLVTRLDDPETGPYPAGPGRTVITAAGATAGLMLGLGLAFLNVAGAPQVMTRSVELPSEAVTIRPRPRTAAVDEYMGPNPAPTALAAMAKQVDGPPSTLRDDEDAVSRTLDSFERSPTNAWPEPTTVASTVATDEGVVEVPASEQSDPPRRTREFRDPLPVRAGVLPQAAGTLPTPTPAPAYSGMNLQEALRAAARQLAN
jgi:hypothetical protein